LTYNLTSITSNSTNIVGFIQGVNQELMLGFLGIMILIGITVITLIAFIQATGDTNKAVAASAFIAFGLALFLKMLDLIPNAALFITLVLAGGAIAFIWNR